jgi:hypothetical protein
MIVSFKRTPAAAAAGILLVSIISARGAFVQLPPNTAETPGLSLSATTGLTGTVIADNTVDFSFALNPNTDGALIFFRNRNILSRLIQLFCVTSQFLAQYRVRREGASAISNPRHIALSRRG